jgi:hypothetical protein
MEGFMSERPKKPSPVSILLEVGIIALGVWRLVGPRELTTPSLVWSWGMIAFGTLGLLLNLLTLIVPATTPEEGAKRLLDQQQQLYGGAHEYRRVGPEAFDGLDLNFYESTTTALESLGFRYLGDVVDVTAAAAWPKAQAVLRVMAGDGGATVVAVYHARFFGFVRLLQLVRVLPAKLHILDVETELDSGTHVATGNTIKADTTAPFPRILKRRYPMDTPPAELLRLHREHVRDALAAEPGARPLRVETLEDALAAQNRAELIKAAHKKGMGYLNDEELKAVLQRKTLSADQKQMLAEIKALNRADAPPPPPA